MSQINPVNTKKLTRSELKAYVATKGCALLYDRSIKTWKLHWDQDRRVHPISLTGVRYKIPENIPLKLIDELCEIHICKAIEFARSDEIQRVFVDIRKTHRDDEEIACIARGKEITKLWN